ncbi:MAG TPA: translation initiation inhibitor [Armatimonadetes bacterium]|nr:translation initiation inhibitor [Armatimonadota bacterium]
MRVVDRLTTRDLTLAARAGESLDSLLARLADGLAHSGAQIIHLLASLPADQADALRAGLAGLPGGLDFPLTILCGRGARSEREPYGFQALIAEGVPVERLEYEGRIVGSRYRDGQATYVMLGDLRARDLSLAPGAQCTVTLESIERIVAPLGLDFHHCVRTWLFADRILDWYGDLNASRHAFFASREVFGRRVPASTGVGIANAAGAAIVAQALLIQPDAGGAVDAQPVPSPLQCPALDYGSAFARAMELSLPGGRRLQISGTASIEPGGATIHQTVEEQIVWTMEVVSALLESRGFRHDQVCRAIAYYADESWFGGLERYQADRGLPAYPLLTMQADICRDDLLFEIELDAAD